jgi:hypothetical protein
MNDLSTVMLFPFIVSHHVIERDAESIFRFIFIQPSDQCSLLAAFMFFWLHLTRVSDDIQIKLGIFIL